MRSIATQVRWESCGNWCLCCHKSRHNSRSNVRAISTVEYRVKIKPLDTYDAPFIRVHYFWSARISQNLRSQKHCLLPRENSQKQPQQAKAVPAQKSSKGTVKCRRKAGYVLVNTGRVQSLQMPVISLILYCKRLTLYGTCLRCDRSLFTVDGYGVGSCKSQRILRPSSAFSFVINIGRSSDVWNKEKLFLFGERQLFSVVRGRITE